MKNSKNGSSNKIIVYQMPLFERLLGAFSAIALIVIPLAYLFVPLYKNQKEFALGIVILVTMIAYCVFMYMCIFKTYICFDLCSNKLVIREFLQTKKEIPLTDIAHLTLSEDLIHKGIFSLDINRTSYTQKIFSWSTHPSCRLAMFRVYERQTKRLRIFVDKCNQYFVAQNS